MSADGGAGQSGAPPPLPVAIWMVAWASLAGEVVRLAREGLRVDDGVSLVLSVVVGALVVGYVSAGVVRARTVRLWIAWIVLGLSLIVDLLGLDSVDHPGEAALLALSFATTVLALVWMEKFRHTDWYAWQRTKPPTSEGASIGELVTIGMLVGVLGGVIGPVDDGVSVRISVSDR